MRWFVVLSLSLVVLVGCGSTTAVTPTPTMDMGHMLHATPNATELALPYDLLFIDGMMMHHLAAIDMANAAKERAQTDNVKILAAAVITAQSAEVTQLRDWRAAWYPDAPMTAGTGVDMGTMQVSDDETIAYDTRWLTAMIDHHEGALEMAQAAIPQLTHPELKSLAEGIVTAQTGEIEQMRSWLP
jgi:uncharacterized protein (DUF305 family)